MSATGHHQQSIKPPEQLFAAAVLAGQSFALGPLDLPLNGVLVARGQQSNWSWPQIQQVEEKTLGGVEPGLHCRRPRRPQLDVAPAVIPLFVPEPLAERRESFGVLDQRLAVIGERERYEPTARDPAANLAEHQGVLKVRARRRRRHRRRLVPVCPLQRLQPARGMKHGGARVTGDQL